MWFFLIFILGIGALAFWMWKRPDPVTRDQAKAVHSDLWLEQADAQMKYAARLCAAPVQPDYERAYQLYSQLAKQFELPQAYMQMGLMHMHGQGRTSDMQSGIGLLEKAFHLGGDEAAFQLGQVYEQQHDAEKALYWYRHAIARGNLDAQYRIAELAPEDPQTAVLQKFKLLKQNAEAGHAGSQYQLAQYYLTDAEHQDLSLGMHYLFQAAHQDHLKANQDIAQYYQQGGILAKDPHKALQFTKRCLLLGDTHGLADYQLAVLRGTIDADQRQRIYHELLDQAKVHKNAQAKAVLGTAHFHGWYADHQETLGFRFWSEAANEGNAFALRQIAALYFEHYLVADDPVKAFELYEYAEQLEPHANNVFGMGLCYFTGRGVQKDAAKAQQLIQVAAQQTWQIKVQAEPDILYVLGLFYSQPAYPLPAHDQALFYLTAAAEQGHAAAQFYLYRIYAGCIFTDVKDHDRAQAYLRQAADSGHAEAQSTLAQALLGQNPQQALQYLQASADQGDMAALYQLGELHEHGKFVPQDMQRAFAFYQQAADKLNPEAYVQLAHMYTYGLGVERNLNIARSWLEKGSLMGHAKSIERLADIDDYLEQRTAF